MILKYSDLKIEVLKKKNLEESQLISFLANAIFLKTNNKNFLWPRKGPIYFKRVNYRGIFNYISHFAFMGAKTSIGIDTRKTKRIIKSLNKNPTIANGTKAIRTLIHNSILEMLNLSL